MAEFRLTKQIIFEAVMTVQAKDGLDAARQLADWKPRAWNMRDGESSSAPYHEPREPQEAMRCPYCTVQNWSLDSARPFCVSCGKLVYPCNIRGCRGHWHVTLVGEDGSEADDISVDGDPFRTREAAIAAMEIENQESFDKRTVLATRRAPNDEVNNG